MADQKELLDGWAKHKSAPNNYFKLMEDCSVEYEFKGSQYGHPSNYAYVQFHCRPGNELQFIASDIFLEKEFERGICIAIVDSLIGEFLHPFQGCSITLSKIKSDEVMGSEVSFYRATRNAMELLKKKNWSICSLKNGVWHPLSS